MCLELLRKMRDLDQIDESSLLKISNQLKRIKGQKIVFLFYQKEALPIPAFLADEAPLELRRGISLDVELIKKAFSDASIIIHFIFLTNKPSDEDNITRFAIPKLAMQDNSDSFFSAFTSLAKTTGGLTQSSANAAASFKRAMDATENYYLLYYHPSDYKQDGQFKEIKVKIKNSNYTVTHRAGYIAD
jgi:VWFA-related protein